ncbi:Hypothetical predicted protein [Podarcis lilfordi]|uniref:Uncharacterized protein n=1 Tax=Podarcis lilfordi TaxID=74358 RepID=A0AA35KZ13_9SAUR|nr:Hypothetical predicted protein [Podarcis lilfordi]
MHRWRYERKPLVLWQTTKREVKYLPREIKKKTTVVASISGYNKGSEILLTVEENEICKKNCYIVCARNVESRKGHSLHSARRRVLDRRRALASQRLLTAILSRRIFESSAFAAAHQRAPSSVPTTFPTSHGSGILRWPRATRASFRLVCSLFKN